MSESKKAPKPEENSKNQPEDQPQDEPKKKGNPVLLNRTYRRFK